MVVCFLNIANKITVAKTIATKVATPPRLHSVKQRITTLTLHGLLPVAGKAMSFWLMLIGFLWSLTNTLSRFTKTLSGTTNFGCTLTKILWACRKFLWKPTTFLSPFTRILWRRTVAHAYSPVCCVAPQTLNMKLLTLNK